MILNNMCKMKCWLSQPNFESQLSSYMRVGAHNFMLCKQSLCRSCFCLHLDCSKENTRFRPQVTVTNDRNCLHMFQTNKQTTKSAWKRTFTCLLNQMFTYQRIVSSVSCLLITLRHPNFELIIRNAFPNF